MKPTLIAGVCFFLVAAGACQAVEDFSLDDLNRRVTVLYDSGKYDEAKRLGLDVLRITQSFYGPRGAKSAVCLNNLAGIHKALGLYEQSRRYYTMALKNFETTHGAGHIEVAVVLNNLGSFYLKQGKLLKAQKLFLRSSSIIGKTLTPSHPIVMKSLNNLAELYKAQGEYDKALALHQKALHLRKVFLGPTHVDTAVSLHNLGEVYKSQEKFKKSESAHREALAIRQMRLGPDHPDTALSLNSLSHIERIKENYPVAESLAKQSLTSREKAFGQSHPDIADSLFSLGLTYQATKRYEEAEGCMQRALEIRKKFFRVNHPDTLLADYDLTLIRKDKEEQRLKDTQIVRPNARIAGPIVSSESSATPATKAPAGLRPADTSVAGTYEHVNKISADKYKNLNAVSEKDMPKTAPKKTSLSIEGKSSESGLSVPKNETRIEGESRPFYKKWFDKLTGLWDLGDTDRIQIKSPGAVGAKGSPQDSATTIAEMQKKATELRAEGRLEEAELTESLVRRLKKTHSLKAA